MSLLKHDVTLRIVKAWDAVLLTVPFTACWFLSYSDFAAIPYGGKEGWLFTALFLVIYIMYGRIYEGFLISINRISDIVYSQGLAAAISDVLLYVAMCLWAGDILNVWPIIIAFLGQVFLASLWAFFAHRWYFRTFLPKRTVIIYDQREGMERLIYEYGMEKKFHITTVVSAEECITRGCVILKDAEAVFLCGIHSHERNIIIKQCVMNKISAYVIPRVGDSIMNSAKPIHLFHLPMLRVMGYNPSPEYLLLKRMFDILFSGVALLIVSPFMLFTAVAIKVADGGPVFYRQCRLTKDGKHFDILKFRSMRVDAERDGRARLSTGDKDDRITPIGRFIRKVRIDELPQLLCILKGDMSIVGPRPERPEIAALYEKELPEFALRLQAKAGLTGYAQVYGKYNTSPYDKLQMDLMYIAHPSILEDLRICFATIKILFIPESTEGIEVGTTTAMGKDGVAAESNVGASLISERATVIHSYEAAMVARSDESESGMIRSGTR